MLRALFGDPPRVDSGPLQDAFHAIHKYMNSLTLIPSDKQTPYERRFVILSQSLVRAIDEMEQSQYAAVRFGQNVKQRYVDQMSREEKDDYHRHLYFYRNALIRLFAILDKLGYFMNERLALQTERIKSRFSYFTVLRKMHEHRLYTDLEQQLYELKMKYKDAVARLRNERNMEIHTINADLLDDLMKAAESKYGERVRIDTDSIGSHIADLEQGCEMTLRAVTIVFRYLIKHPAAAGSRPPHRQG
ncbi:hypothetical protein PAESOLCIP111_01924 [Paenibacillus solanacearum]|uniref:Cthe-2314-like HEPN domain-containing protein n=1 Tax=Paenibacillus solanacearum TaxID=2048548 RepID=A0A916NIG6_9BACL|nr:Cthe_2314 family HEPN domain-containing protein [Paenibacillus solanacearum]CAG7616604.1 hypothetical protein PAESOLCIP111_01924 [Paenibacillus solanacearum]